MKKRIILLISVFLYFLFIFLLDKVAFMLMHLSMAPEISMDDAVAVLYHGLPLDLSMSAYLTVIPALLIIFSIWVKPSIISKILTTYYVIILTAVTIITVADIALYPYWGFHFDATIFLYLQKPKEAFASASPLEIALGFAAVFAFIAVTIIGYIYLIKPQVKKLVVPKSLKKSFIVLTLLTATLFLPMRGGISVSTMNTGSVYFSDNMFLNHAAINPQFNLMYSFFKSEDFGSQYQFFDQAEASSIVKALNYQPQHDSIPQLLNTDKPNIIFFIVESLSENVYKNPSVVPNLRRFASEGVSFTNFYANSFRTDRGLVSILSGYPAHPTTAIMKYPKKTESLPAIPKSLKKEGYDLSFYYGGDVDFANMRSYFVGACGIKDIISDKSFPMSDRMTKWGVPDHIVLDRVYADLTKEKYYTPFMKTVLTLSSHEPFDVPTRKFGEPFLDAIAYTDSCLGKFVNKLRATELWQNTLIVFVPDHCMQSYPQGLNNYDPQRFQIPMIWTGGAIKSPAVVSGYGSQNDIAATIFSQLKVRHDDFTFSKDMMNPDSRKFAFYSYVNGFSMIDSTGTVIYDNDKQSIIQQTGNTELEKKAKAFFQMMYLDLGGR